MKQDVGKVEYVDSLYCGKKYHLSSLSTCACQWDSCTCDCTCERVEHCIHACEFVCVNSRIFYSLIVLEHA